MSIRTGRLIPRLAAATTAMALGGTFFVATTASPASAAGRNGKCESGEFCYYYGAGTKGSLSDFTGSVGDYGAKQPKCYEFKSKGAGKGKCVKNNAGSVWNRTKKTVRVYFNSNYRGKYQDIKPGKKANLSAKLRKQNASHRVGTPPKIRCKTDGSNTRLPTVINVWRVKLGRVEPVSFKYYVKNVLPNEWYPSWKRESLRAGAVAVKNHGWYWALHSNRKVPGTGQCYDVRDDHWSQVYRPGSAKASTSAAVDATWGTRMTRKGKIFNAQYCARPSACPAWRNGDWLSQEGSQAYAKAGRSFSWILKHYYRGIALKR